MKMSKQKNISGFTFVELLVSLIVSSIIFSAIASLVFAVGAANDSSTEISTNQARIRFTTIRIHELIKYSKLVTLSGTDDLAIWVSDDDNDNQIDLSETAFIETGSGHGYIWLLEYQGVSAAVVGISLSDLKDGSAKTTLITSGNYRRTKIIPQCSNVTFIPANVNEQDEFVCISFDISEKDQTRHYQISSKLLCRVDNLIDSGSIVSGDDD